MNFAVIPFNESYENNALFMLDSANNRDNLAHPFYDMKEYLDSRGHSINTIDCCKDLNSIDYFLFLEWREDWMDKLIRHGFASKMVYCNAEPPTVKELNTPEGYRIVHKYFPYIMTWNKEIVDNIVFFYRTIPYTFTKRDFGLPFNEKKLLTSISANKKSDYKDELYSEREKLISYFEKEIPNEFDMYGVGWENSAHPSYKGSPLSKFEIYSKYKFAIALENTKNVKGYVTEKIFDCLTGGIVPIYMGADDICEYVSESSFIDYRKIATKKELLDMLLTIDENKYNSYLQSGRRDVERLDKSGVFSGARYAENILEMVEKAHQNDFQVALADELKLHFHFILIKTIRSIKNKIKQFIVRN